VVDENHVIICGHTRLKAAQKLGMVEVPVHVATDLPAEKVAALRLADNKAGELAEWDFEKLDLELADINIDMGDFGFSETTDVIESTSTDRDGQGVNSTWDQVKKGENAKIVIGELETSVPKELATNIFNFCVKMFEEKNIPIKENVISLLEAGLENCNNR
jgi:hypothetical protein